VPLATALGRQCDCGLVVRAKPSFFRSWRSTGGAGLFETGMTRRRHWRAKALASGTRKSFTALPVGAQISRCAPLVTSDEPSDTGLNKPWKRSSDEHRSPARTRAAETLAAVHAGLECGVLSSRIAGGLDAVSFGPNIKGNHAPGERVEIRSVQKQDRALDVIRSSTFHRSAAVGRPPSVCWARVGLRATDRWLILRFKGLVYPAFEGQTRVP
jgi:hypothetical protein